MDFPPDSPKKKSSMLKKISKSAKKITNVGIDLVGGATATVKGGLNLGGSRYVPPPF